MNMGIEHEEALLIKRPTVATTFPAMDTVCVQVSLFD
jgi:hypothetical protein